MGKYLVVSQVSGVQFSLSRPYINVNVMCQIFISIAQWTERNSPKVEVAGSIPARDTMLYSYIKHKCQA